jgi:hypothetical protein
MAELAEKAAQFRDTGGSRQQFLDLIQQATLDDEEKVKEDKRAMAQNVAVVAYETPSLSPKKIRDTMMTVCTDDLIMRAAENQGKAIGGIRSCAIDSLQHEALLEEVFQLLTTDATTLAAERGSRRGTPWRQPCVCLQRLDTTGSGALKTIDASCVPRRYAIPFSRIHAHCPVPRRRSWSATSRANLIPSRSGCRLA